MNRIFTTVLGVIIAFSLSANNVEITNVTNSGINVTFDITWENSWNLGAGYTVGDGVWVVVKQAPNGGPSWTHSNVISASVGANYETLISDDNVSFFIKHTTSFNGTSSTSVTATYSFGGTYRDIKVMAVEIVTLNGQVLKEGDVNGNEQIDISALNSGTYVLQLVADGKTDAQKIIKL